MLDQAIRQGAILAGKMGSGGSRVIKELLEPKVNWREELREFVTSIATGKDMSSWRKPNRRHLHTGLYVPSMVGETMGPMVVAIDTSGSIGQREVDEFAAELCAICNEVSPESVTLLWWDTEVRGEQRFERGEYEAMRGNLKPAGGGGTTFACVPVYIDRLGIKPEAMVVLTDGYISGWGNKPDYPVLFGITSNVKAPYGVTVPIKEM